MKTIFIALIAIFTYSTATSQTKPNSIYLEALGNGVVYSINYDRVIPLSSHVKLAPRVGFEFIPRKLENYSPYGNWSFPLELNLLYSKSAESKNHFEGGLGLSLFSLVENYKQNNNGKAIKPDLKMGKITMLRLGFRHQKPSGGLMYRAGVMARLSQDHFSKSLVFDDLFYRIWPGVSIGYSF